MVPPLVVAHVNRDRCVKSGEKVVRPCKHKRQRSVREQHFLTLAEKLEYSYWLVAVPFYSSHNAGVIKTDPYVPEEPSLTAPSPPNKTKASFTQQWMLLYVSDQKCMNLPFPAINALMAQGKSH